MGWKKEHGGHIPHHAVLAGYDKDGSPLYVGRAHHRGDVIPGKISPSHRVLYIPYGGKEHHVSHYEVLKNSAKYHWMRSRNGQREPGSLKGGKQSDGTKLYIGRTTMGGVTVIGKVHPGHGCLYVPYNGDEHKVYEYEILVKRRYHPTLPSHPPPYSPPSAPFPGQPHVPSGPFPGQHPPGPGIYPPLGPVYILQVLNIHLPMGV
ncbi:hypothetical protein RDWZM_006431 [Blomia tropicalis]|uniref:Uncharacterized protein n=1 Tax=Blomia tropicalis TaxID=40697 RepID=A0A9Q0M825_BLOTA|nr:hypothetical protein RDWZM_006431 [Blomia tropicalis]